MLRWKSCLDAEKTIKAYKPEPEDATHDKVEYFDEESLDITLARVITIVLTLTRFLCREAISKLKTNLKIYLRRFKGQKLVMFAHMSFELFKNT